MNTDQSSLLKCLEHVKDIRILIGNCKDMVLSAQVRRNMEALESMIQTEIDCLIIGHELRP